MRPLCRAALAGMTALSFLALPLRAGAGDVVVFAAASLSDALSTVARAWEGETGQGAALSFASSAVLARQIMQGAPADIYISASTDWMDAVEGAGDLRPGTRRDLLGNRLVLIAHGRDAPPLRLDPPPDLVALLQGGRLSMALVESVPAGIYGRAALGALGLWEAVAPHVAQSDNVRAALAFVARGEAPLGIVYATDAAAEARVSIVATFPGDSHPPIILPAAIAAQSESPHAEAFLDFLSSAPARAIWQDYGFELPD